MKTLAKKIIALAAMVLLAPLFIGGAVADSNIIVKAYGAKKFATLPGGVTNPEGITINTDNGEVIVGTFSPLGDTTLMRFSSSGKLKGTRTIDQDHGALLGLAYKDGYVYICNAALITKLFTTDFDPMDMFPDVNAGVSRIERIRADLTGDIETITTGGAGDPDDVDTTVFLSPNDLTFDSANNLYFSDSFAGTIIKVVADNNADMDDDPFTCWSTDSCTVETIAETPAMPMAGEDLLVTSGFPGFGANGVAFNGDETILYVANTGDDRVLEIDMTGIPADFPKTPTILAQSVNGADGVIFDAGNNLLWVAANQGDHVVAIDPDTGRVVAQIGAFLGVRDDGAARGLSFPASLAQASDGKILVTNLAAVLFGNGSEPEADVTTGTVSFINIPDFDD